MARKTNFDKNLKIRFFQIKYAFPLGRRYLSNPSLLSEIDDPLPPNILILFTW